MCKCGGLAQPVSLVPKLEKLGRNLAVLAITKWNTPKRETRKDAIVKTCYLAIIDMSLSVRGRDGVVSFFFA